MTKKSAALSESQNSPFRDKRSYGARRAIYPGCFDPFTIGHEDITRKAMKVFDEVVILISENSSKKSTFTTDQRVKLIREVFKNDKNVSVAIFTGLTANYCINNHITHIVRGVRNANDFLYERDLALLNSDLAGVETVFFNSSDKNTHVSSTLLRELLRLAPQKAQLYAPSNIYYQDFLQ